MEHASTHMQNLYLKTFMKLLEIIFKDLVLIAIRNCYMESKIITN